MLRYLYKKKIMNNLFEISSEEKNRILNLHETATKRQYLTLEQDEKVENIKTVFPKQNVGNQFKFGEYQSDVVKSSIAGLKPNIEKFINENGGKEFIVNISAGESNVTNPKGFETKGSLALARANSVKQYFQEIFSDLIKKGTLIIKSPEDVSQVVLGKTPYDKTKGDIKNPEKIKLYNQEQFVTFDIVGSGNYDKITKDFCKFSRDAKGGVAPPESGFLGYNETLDISSVSTGKLLTIKLNPYQFPDLLVVTLGNETKSSGFVGLGLASYLGILATILGNQYTLKGNPIPSIFPSDIEPMPIEEAKKLFRSNIKFIEDKTKHVLTEVNWQQPAKVVLESIKFYKFKTNPVKSRAGVITFTKPEGVSEINVKVYSPIGDTIWNLNGACQR
jgi:hypothetical protein